MAEDRARIDGEDYSEDQKEAAHRILVELVGLFSEYKDEIRIVGGWVPDLLFPDEGHIGSIDVDVLINHLKLQEAGYQTMEKILLQHGYRRSAQHYFTFVKDVVVNGENYPVDVDILAGMYGGSENSRSQHVQGLRALKATGGNLAFEFAPEEVTIEAKRPDGAVSVAHINVVGVIPFLIMKTAALDREKPKDAYDIYFVIRHFGGGVEKLAEEIAPYKDRQIVQRTIQRLKEMFASENHAAPRDVADFVNPYDEQEAKQIRRDASEQVLALVELLG